MIKTQLKKKIRKFNRKREILEKLPLKKYWNKIKKESNKNRISRTQCLIQKRLFNWAYLV